jgi:hypothetical protein
MIDPAGNLAQCAIEIAINGLKWDLKQLAIGG